MYVTVPMVFSGLSTLAMAPVVHWQTWVSNSDNNVAAYLRSRSEVLDRQAELERKLAALSGSDRTIQRLQRENRELRSLLGAATTTDRVAAEVLERPNVLAYDTILINRGTMHGVAEGAPVYVGADLVIGRVSRVQERISLVTLLTSPGEEVTVYIVGPNVYATAVGRGGGVLEIQVPQGVPVAAGQSIILPRAAQSTFGTVDEVRTVASEPMQAVYATVPVSLQSLRWVAVGETLPAQASFDDLHEEVQQRAAELFLLDVPSDYLVRPTATSSATSTPSGVATSTPTSTSEL